MRPRPQSPALALSLLLSAVLSMPNRTEAAPPSPELQRVLRAVFQPDSAQWAAAELRRMLAAGKIDSTWHGMAGHILVQSLMTREAPAAEVLAATDSAIASFARNAGEKADFHNEAGDYLEAHGDSAGAEARFRMAAAAQAGYPGYEYVRASTLCRIASYEIKRAEYTAALANFDSALAVTPADNVGYRQWISTMIGYTHGKAGNLDQAIDAYLISAGTFGGSDTSAAAGLRDTWTRKHGSLEGLDAELATRRAASMQKIAFDSRRFEQTAPNWTLKDIAGRSVSLAASKGKVVVLDFWGSWCPPCRQELPHLQKAYEKYGARGVVFTTVNVENANSPAEHARIASEFMKKNRYTFPVAPDPDRIAVEAHGVRSYPTLYVLDRTGKIRFRNIGYTTSEILAAQIDLLLTGK